MFLSDGMGKAGIVGGITLTELAPNGSVPEL
jgi:hypothetical protein